MEQLKRLTTRRGAIGRMLGVALGAGGVGAFAGAKAEAAQKPLRELTLYAPNLHTKKVGTRSLLYGAVVDAKDRYRGTINTALLDSTAGTLTHQTFELEDGTLQGIGSNGTFVLVGGTGRYTGIAGSYVDRSATRLPGREYVFTFREATHGS